MANQSANNSVRTKTKCTPHQYLNPLTRDKYKVAKGFKQTLTTKTFEKQIPYRSTPASAKQNIKFRCKKENQIQNTAMDDMYEFSPTASSPRMDDDDDGQPGNRHPLVPDNAITPKVPKRLGTADRTLGSRVSSLNEGRVRQRTLNANGGGDDSDSNNGEEENFDDRGDGRGSSVGKSIEYPPMQQNFEGGGGGGRAGTAAGGGSFGVGADGGIRSASRTSNYSPNAASGSHQQPPALGGAFRPTSSSAGASMRNGGLPPRGPSAMAAAMLMGTSVRTNMSGLNNGNAPLSARDRAQSMSLKPSVATQLIRGGGGALPMVVSTTPSEIKTGAYTTEERRAASKMSGQDLDDDDGGDGPLFMPGVKREQFIPVRVAREKIKEVLSEMASMKNKHLAAIETMEKQHQYLKNQLETACAAYAKKLTNDYNTRVSALDAEYCRRLAKLSGETAEAEVAERLRTAREAATALEQDVSARLEAKDKEAEAFKAQLTTQLDRERSNRDDLLAKLKIAEDRSRELELVNASQAKELDALRDGVPLPVIDHAATEERLRTLQGANDGLQQEVATLRRRHDEETLRLEEEITALEAELNQLRDIHGGTVGTGVGGGHHLHHHAGGSDAGSYGHGATTAGGEEMMMGGSGLYAPPPPPLHHQHSQHNNGEAPVYSPAEGRQSSEDDFNSSNGDAPRPPSAGVGGGGDVLMGEEGQTPRPGTASGDEHPMAAYGGDGSAEAHHTDTDPAAFSPREGVDE